MDKGKTYQYSSEDDAILQLRTLELAVDVEDSRKEVRSLLCFTLGKDVFALNTNDVKQVVTHSEVLEVPHSADCIIGIVNIRGTIITVCDSAIILSGTPLDRQQNYYMLYINHDETPLCFAIAQTPENINVAIESIEPVPEDDDNRNIELIEAYARHGNKFIQILSVEQLLQHRYLSQLLTSSNAE
jgi:purine-binding chemotaxis protein CheW